MDGICAIINKLDLIVKEGFLRQIRFYVPFWLCPFYPLPDVRI